MEGEVETANGGMKYQGDLLCFTLTKMQTKLSSKTARCQGESFEIKGLNAALALAEGI